MFDCIVGFNLVFNFNEKIWSIIAKMDGYLIIFIVVYKYIHIIKDISVLTIQYDFVIFKDARGIK
jgi:hypothetical protein